MTAGPAQVDQENWRAMAQVRAGMSWKPFPVTPVGDMDMADCDVLVSRYRIENTHRCGRAPFKLGNIHVQNKV